MEGEEGRERGGEEVEVEVQENLLRALSEVCVDGEERENGNGMQSLKVEVVH